MRQRAARQDLRDWLPDAAIIVIDEDPVGATFDYLDRDYPDGGHLIRVEGENTIEVMAVRRCGSYERTEDHVAEDALIHPDAEIGMLFDYLRSFPGKRLHCIAERPEYEVVIAPDGDLRNLLVPGA